MKCKNLLIFVALFLTISKTQLFSQTDNDAQASSKKFRGWQSGYIILKNSNEKMYGFIKIKTKDFSEVITVKFRKKLKDKKGTLKVENYYVSPQNDTIQFFGFSDKSYMWMNYADNSDSTDIKSKGTNITGWVEIIEQGKITLYKGVCDVDMKFNNSFNYSVSSGRWRGRGTKRVSTPCMCLKKENENNVILKNDNNLIFQDDNYLDSVLSVNSTTNLLNAISDFEPLYKKWKLEEIKFKNVEKIVHLYNQPIGAGNNISITTEQGTKSEKSHSKRKEKNHENDIKATTEKETPSEKLHSNHKENKTNKDKKLHNGFQYSIFVGSTVGNNKANLNGTGNVVFYNVPSTNFGISIGYAINNWAFGYTCSYNDENQYSNKNLKVNRTINDTLFQNIQSIDNTFNGIYIKKYFMPNNIFVSIEAGLGRFFIIKYINYDFLPTNDGFAWNIKAGKDFLIGKSKKYAMGGYVNLTSINCSYLVSNSKDLFSYFAPGIGLTMSFN